MIDDDLLNERINIIEGIILKHFKQEPFHNLFLLYSPELKPFLPGGTCSDKTLSFICDCRKHGIDASLHNSFINKKNIHRLARISIHNKIYFADVGNGWPALKLYPADKEISYSCFGMQFRTEIKNDYISVFHLVNGKESLQQEIPLNGKPETEIMEDIKQRFNEGKEYPFSHSLRFSLLKDNCFLFLRGERLHFYQENSYSITDRITAAKAPKIIHEYFGFDIEQKLQELCDNHSNQSF